MARSRKLRIGLSIDDYRMLLGAQKGGCAICGRPPKTRALSVDHDHATGDIRGLLCHRCNRALPTWITRSWLERAIAYLDPSPAFPTPSARIALDVINRKGTEIHGQ